MAARVRLSGFDATVFNLGALAGPLMNAAVAKALAAVGDIAVAECYRNLTRTDHTLAQLRSLDHPYAKRHGSIQIHPTEPHVVHTHSGKMAASLRGQIVQGRTTRSTVYRVDFGASPEPYVKWVVRGTKVMLGRDVLYQSINAPHMRVPYMRAFVRVMGAELRSRAGLRFGGP